MVTFPKNKNLLLDFEELQFLYIFFCFLFICLLENLVCILFSLHGLFLAGRRIPPRSNTFHHGKMRKAGLFLLSLSLSQHLGYNTFTFSTPWLRHLHNTLFATFKPYLE